MSHPNAPAPLHGAATRPLPPLPPPSVRRTCATRVRLSELITLDLPTLGRPTMPTVMAVLMSLLRA
jgi:hypothetical protein